MLFRIIVLITGTVVGVHGLFDALEPGQVLSRFDYDYKMLQKMVQLEADVKKLKDLHEQNNTVNFPTCCSDGWVRFENSCYFFGNTDLSFNNAVLYCIELGSHLINLESVSESVWIEGVLRNLKAPKHWIAMTDEQKEGLWAHYPSGKPTTFVRWGKGEPNQGSSANCLAIWESFDYLWVDEPCNNKFRPICERG